LKAALLGHVGQGMLHSGKAPDPTAGPVKRWSTLMLISVTRGGRGGATYIGTRCRNNSRI
jgi:hypothetical protein